MPNNSKKSLKDIKGDKIHPFSRKAAQINRVQARVKRINSVKKQHKDEKILPIVEKWKWFRKESGKLQQQSLSVQQCHSLIQLYIERNDGEIESLQQSRVHGSVRRPKPPRLTLLEMMRQKDLNEYENVGFVIPDLTNAKNVTVLQGWNGDYQCIDIIKTITLKTQKDASKTINGEDLQMKE
ncbi:hypothetical protein MP228_002114 [Amoeboaphelidium protococcarum]|nr:hypothetical protein MP228_002114 [Amoeboaphelidium protococcarum]